VSPPKDEVTSLSSVGESAQNCAAAFATTHWSVVLEAQGQSPAAQEALEKLCRTYWRPVYSFIRREGTAPEEAEDFTQEFFAMLLKRRNFDDVRKEKGRLRSYLPVSASANGLRLTICNPRVIVRDGRKRTKPLSALIALLYRYKSTLR
jgi:hypothetical protein